MSFFKDKKYSFRNQNRMKEIELKDREVKKVKER